MTSEKTKRPAVFLDRDGTICEEVGYLSRPEQLQLIKGSAEAICLLNRANIRVVVTTNQSGVARGYFTEEDVRAVHQRLEALLAAQGARVDAIYYCPHHPDKGEGQYRVDCECRKPRPGMLRQAARDLPIDLSHSYVVGDKLSDIQLGREGGLHTCLVLTGYGEQEKERIEKGETSIKPDFVAQDLHQAVNWILNDLREKGVSLALNEKRYPLRKLVTLEEAVAIREKLRAEGKRVVMANGCFDVLHGGHISYLTDARAQGDCLIVAVNSDSSERALKGPSRPIYDEAARLEILNGLRCVDYLILFDDLTVEPLLRALRPDVHAKGTDYTKETVPERAIAIELGIETYIAGAPKQNSSRDVISTVIERFSESAEIDDGR